VSNVYLALAPVFILIAIGYIARASRIMAPEAFGAVNRFGYFVLYPAFLFMIVTQADFSNADALPFVAGVVLGFAAVIVIGLGLRLVFRGDGPAYSSFFQGVVRWNGFPILAAATAIYGEAGLELIGIAFGPLVFFVNIACVIVLARYGAAKAASWRAMLDQIVANPLILGCGAGLLAQAIGFTDFGPISRSLDLLGDAAMPVALITVGAGLDFSALRADAAKIGVATFVKLIVAPLIIWQAALFMGASPLAAAVAAGMGATPTAAAGYTLAREMGGDARLIAAIITATTIVSFFTMPLMISLALH